MIRKNIARILILLLILQVFPLNAIERNIDILSRLNLLAINSITAQIKSNNLSFRSVSVSEHSSNNFFSAKLYPSLDSILSKSIDSKNTLKVSIITNNVHYKEYEANKDSLLRVNEIALLAKVTNEQSDIYIFKDLNYKQTDTIARKDIDYIQTTDNPFTCSIPPSEKKSFWEELAGPAIVLGSAIITVVLLFTVRSK